VFTVHLTAEWMAWVAALAAPLHRRSAWRLATVVAGILLAQGRRTASSWWRAAGIGHQFRSYYYFLDSLGRKTTAVAAVVFALLRIAHHNHSGTIGLPLLGRLYIREKDLPKLPEAIDWEFRTKPRLAAEIYSARAGLAQIVVGGASV
jgi:hypothetical protein